MRRTAPTARPGAAEHAAGYRYQRRAPERGSLHSREGAEQMVRALATHRHVLCQFRARLRTLTWMRDEAIAQAVASGLGISVIAGTVGETVPSIRRVARAFDDPQPGTLTRNEHLQALRHARTELDAATSSKASVERDLRALVAQAYARGFTDEVQLAAMAGVSVESVHRALGRHRTSLREPRPSGTRAV